MTDRIWFKWHEQHPTDLTPEEVEATSAALIGILTGDLAPLAALLKRPMQTLPTDIRLALVLAIEGDKKETPVRLRTARHPAYGPNENTVLDTVERREEELLIAKHIEEAGGLERGQHEAAISSAMDKFGRKRSFIERAWSKHKNSPWKGKAHLFSPETIALILVSET